MKRAKQLGLELRNLASDGTLRGGARPGAGRKSARPDGRPGVAHATRDRHVGRHPVHVTLRAVDGACGPGLRREDVLRVLYACIAAATSRGRYIVEFSLQENHLHLIAEAKDATELTATARGIASITARRFNRCLGRSGQLWEDRYHRHDLRTPTEVRNALSYVLHNHRKHARGADEKDARLASLDPFSSAAWFDGWDDDGRDRARVMRAWLEARGFRRCTATPRTYLLIAGWRTVAGDGGALAFDAAPRSAA